MSSDPDANEGIVVAAAACEVIFALVLGSLALGLPAARLHDGSGALPVLLLQCACAIIAAIGLGRGHRWGWVFALGAVVPTLIRVVAVAWVAAHLPTGTGLALPLHSLPLLLVAWVTQAVVVICFLRARGWRAHPSAPA